MDDTDCCSVKYKSVFFSENKRCRWREKRQLQRTIRRLNRYRGFYKCHIEQLIISIEAIVRWLHRVLICRHFWLSKESCCIPSLPFFAFRYSGIRSSHRTSLVRFSSPIYSTYSSYPRDFRSICDCSLVRFCLFSSLASYLILHFLYFPTVHFWLVCVLL